MGRVTASTCLGHPGHVFPSSVALLPSPQELKSTSLPSVSELGHVIAVASGSITKTQTKASAVLTHRLSPFLAATNHTAAALPQLSWSPRGMGEAPGIPASLAEPPGAWTMPLSPSPTAQTQEVSDQPTEAREIMNVCCLRH